MLLLSTHLFSLVVTPISRVLFIYVALQVSYIAEFNVAQASDQPLLHVVIATATVSTTIEVVEPPNTKLFN